MITKYEILVNKENPLPEDFKPDNLVKLNSKLEGNFLLEKEAAFWFDKLRDDGKKNGYEIDIDINNGAYRSLECQQEVLNYYLKEIGEEAYKKVAIPGTSEHHTGLAIDFALFVDGEYIDDIKVEDVKATKWIHENAYKYGFTLRYPKDKEHITKYIYEPWHLRYVGEILAKYLYDNKLTLEEYYEKDN